MSSPDHIASNEFPRDGIPDTQEKAKTTTRQATEEALKDVLAHQISLARELIFSATLAGRDPKSISFHHIINRLMTILQLQVGFVVLKKVEEKYQLVYISNTDREHRSTIGESVTAAIAQHSQQEHIRISLTDDSNTDAKPFYDVFYPIFNTNYSIGVLKCLKKDKYDFEWIYRIAYIKDVENGWDVAGYKMARILSYEEDKDKYIGDNFYTALEDALDRFSEELSHKNGYNPKNALEEIEKSKQDFWKDIYKGEKKLSEQTKKIIAETKNKFETKLLVDYTTEEYGIVGKSIVDTIYQKSVPNIKHVVGETNEAKLDNFFLLTRFYENKDYLRYKQNYDYCLRVAVCKAQRNAFIKYFERLFDNEFSKLNEISKNIKSEDKDSPINIIVDGVINTIKKIFKFENIGKLSDTGTTIGDKEAISGLLVDIINKPLSSYTKSIADGVFTGGVSFFRQPFREDLALGRSGLTIDEASKYLTNSLLFKEEKIKSYDSFKNYIEDIYNQPSEDQKYLDFFRAFLCRLLFEDMTPPVHKGRNNSKYQLFIMMNPIEIGGKVLAVATYLTRARDPSEAFKSPEDVRYFNKYWLQNYHISENVNDRIKRVIRMDMEKQYIESCAAVYKECLENCLSQKIFVINDFYIRLKILSLFYPYGHFNIKENKNIIPKSMGERRIPNNESKNVFIFSQTVSFELKKLPDDTSHSPFSIAIGYWHSKNYHYVDRADIAIALSNQYLNFINMIKVPE